MFNRGQLVAGEAAECVQPDLLACLMAR